MTNDKLVISNASQIPVAFDSEAIKARAKKVAEQCTAIVIADESSLTIGTAILKDANKISALIEKKRKALKEPFLDMGKRIDNAAKELTEEIDAAVKSGKEKVLAYNKIVEANRREEESRLQRLRFEAEETERKEKARIERITKWILTFESESVAEINQAESQADLANVYANRITTFPEDTSFDEFLETAQAALARVKDAGLQRKLHLQQLAKVNDEKEKEALALKELERQTQVNEKLDEAQIDIQEKMNTELEYAELNKGMADAAIASEQMESDNTKVNGIRKTWTFEVVDPAIVPRHWLTVDKAVVDEYLKENKDRLEDGIVIAGIRFYRKEGVALR